MFVIFALRNNSKAENIFESKSVAENKCQLFFLVFGAHIVSGK